MDAWIPITIAAAFCLNVRSALQKSLKTSLSTLGATSARFVFAAPLAVLILGLVMTVKHTEVAPVGVPFFAYAVAGGVAQILGTVLLIHLFSYKSFTVATTFTKTETIQTALFGILLLGDRLTFLAALGIMISLIGVIFISLPAGQEATGKLLDHKALIGAVSGGMFGMSAVAYRGASLSIGSEDVLLRAAMTLAFVTSLQAVLVLGWLRLREPGEIGRLFGRWKVAGLVGLAGMLSSLGWFTAFTLQNAAYVRALGQIDIVFTLGASFLFFKETVTAREIFGVFLVSLGIVGIVLAAS